MEPSAEERPPLSGPLDVSDRLSDSPSSNERNTNTLCSGSESDVMKTPSVGGDSPGVFTADGSAPATSVGAAAAAPPTATNGSPSAPAAGHTALSPLVAGGAANHNTTAPVPLAGGDAAADHAAAAAAHTATDSAPHEMPSPPPLEKPPAAAQLQPSGEVSRCAAGCVPPAKRRRASGRGVRTTYHSQISPDANSIKLKIRMQTLGPEETGARRRRKSETDGAGKSRRRRRSRRGTDSEEEGGSAPAPTRRKRAKSAAALEEAARPQAPWADRLPAELLHRIFSHAVDAEGGGAVPALVRLARVCQTWRAAAATADLWHTVDLATGRIPERRRHERLLVWLAQNRFSQTENLNLAGWSGAVTAAAVAALCDGCPRLRRLSLAGCRALGPDELLLLAERCQRLSVLDLSDVTPDSAHHRSPLSPLCMQRAAQLLGARLSSLTLAHNCVGGIQLILNALADHCPNLEVLDLSNIMTAVRDIVPVRIERLQAGCRRLRVLRWTNTELKLADATLKEQTASEGFPELEELSVAVPRDRHCGLDDAGVERMLKSSQRLRLLDVRGCQRLSDSSLVRVPAWNLQHLFLSGCEATRALADRLELVVRKWRHSLLELDLSWATNQRAVDAALSALAEPDPDAAPPPLVKLDLRGAAGTFAPVCRLLAACPQLHQLNLTSCRALPRGVKRLFSGDELARLRDDVAAGKYREEEQPPT